MTYSIAFRPEVEEDAVSNYLWYEERAKGLGEEFLRAFYASASELSRNPLIYQTVHKDFRRKLLKRFPYAIYFRIREKQVIVYGLFHCSRNPNFMDAELRKRKKE